MTLGGLPHRARIGRDLHIRKSGYYKKMKGYPTPILQDGQAIIGSTVISIKNVALDGYINSGANGFVFSGTDLQLDRRVAVKVWPPRTDRSMSDANRTGQVLAEARKIARFKDSRIASMSFIQNPIIRGNPVHSSASQEISRHAGVSN
jgi:hypothetical protein